MLFIYTIFYLGLKRYFKNEIEKLKMIIDYDNEVLEIASNKIFEKEEIIKKLKVKIEEKEKENLFLSEKNNSLKKENEGYRKYILRQKRKQRKQINRKQGVIKMMKLIERDGYGEITLKSIFKIMGVLFLSVGILLGIFSSMYTIKTGEVGIITRFGKVVRVSKAGMNFKLSFLEKVNKIETRDTLIEEKFSVSSRDMQTVLTNIALQYRIVDSLEIFSKFKNEYEFRLVKPRLAEIVQSVTSDYTIEELVDKRQQVSQNMYENLKKDLKQFGIEVVKVSIKDHDFSDSFETAIEEKKAAEQQAQKIEIENNQKIKTAEANLKVKELEAKANAVLTESLTKEVLNKMYIEKWDGKLPQYQGGSANPILNMN